MNTQIISLIVLILAIALSFVKKLNIGFLAIAIALLMGRYAGLKDKEIISGFNASLFVMLVGVTYLFSVAQTNGTLDLVAKKVVGSARKHTYLIPIIMYVLMAVLAAVGPGTIPTFALSAAFGIPLGLAMKIDPLLLTSMGQLGSIGGGMTKIAPTGIIGIELSNKAGLGDVSTALIFNSMLITVILAIATYIYYKGWTIRGENPVNLSELPALDSKQKITLLGILAMLVMVLFFKINVGLASFLVAGALVLLKVADEKKSITAIPWGTLLLVTGVGVLMNVVITIGGITLLADALSTIMSTRTASTVIAATAGIMSWFSSTSGVVMPTLIPTVPQIMASVQNLSATEMVSAVSLGASVAGLSPASTGGALVLASYLTNKHLDENEQNKLFMKLFITSVIFVITITVLVYFGIFTFI